MDILFNNIPELKNMPIPNGPDRHRHTDIQIIKCGIHIRKCNGSELLFREGRI